MTLTHRLEWFQRNVAEAGVNLVRARRAWEQATLRAVVRKEALEQMLRTPQDGQRTHHEVRTQKTLTKMIRLHDRAVDELLAFRAERRAGLPELDAYNRVVGSRR